jgi:hypothetical protein
MRLTAAAPAVLALALLATACGASRTPAEERFIAEMADKSTQVELSDSQISKYLDNGHATCEVLEGTKPKDRPGAKYFMQQPSRFGYGVVNAATTHLCPELK